MQPRHLPPEWRYRGFEKPFAVYLTSKLVCSMQLIQPRKNAVTVHCAVSRVDGRRPTQEDVDKVKKDFFVSVVGRVEENNRILLTPETVRNLWQRVELSSITGDILTPEQKRQIEAAAK